MKRVIFVASTMIMLLFGNCIQAGVSVVMNGSFEDDGEIGDITAEAPEHWCDVNVPADKFGGDVYTDWSTHGYGDGYSLTLYSYDNATFDAGDRAAVSQQVYLEDVNQVIFDIRLATDWPDIRWDPNKFSALLLIDGNDIVWDSNDCVVDVNSECRNQYVDVSKYKGDPNSHTLSLAMRANIAQASPSYIFYLAQWDFVKFDTHCGGFGYLPEDLNRDCYVDFLDYAMLANHWLEESPAYEYDLVEDSIVDEYDLMVFADGWLDCSYWERWRNDNCYEMALLDGDLNNDGIVNLLDFAILAGDWGSADDCIRSNIDRLGAVDYRDLSIMADEWLERSWLYGL